MRSWRELITKLGQGIRKTKGDRAVHRPLLLLYIFGQARAGGSNRFPFKDLVEPLEKALREFGPERKRLHPEYPFWHLKDELFWEIEASEGLEEYDRTRGPSKGVLLRVEAVGVVPHPQWKALRGSTTLIDELANDLLTAYWRDSSDHVKIRKQFGL